MKQHKFKSIPKHRMGLVWVDGRVQYGLNTGRLLKFPNWVKKSIEAPLNYLACKRLGHEYLEWTYIDGDVASDPYCLHCGHYDKTMEFENVKIGGTD